MVCLLVLLLVPVSIRSLVAYLRFASLRCAALCCAVLRRVVAQVGARFSKTEELRKLTSDATNYFPVEFEMCDAVSLRRTFVQQRRAMSGF